MSNTEEKFDWVKARQDCSLGAGFELLKMSIVHDIETRNLMRKPYIPEVTTAFLYKFQLVTSGNSFAVVLDGQGTGLHKAVKFTLTDARIEVRNDAGSMFNATVGLNDEGECTFFVDDKERASWHLRKMALEELFFRFV